MAGKPTVFHVYNPKNQTPDQLIDGFVVRQKLFNRLFKEIQQSSMEYPEQHYLIAGKRGMGKTTILLRLSYEIEEDESLKNWLIPIVFNEEEYGIRRLYKFWLRIGELLAEKKEGFQDLLVEMEDLSLQFEDDQELEKELYNILINQLQEQEKKIILFIDNFGDMFQKFNEREAHRLRKILQTAAEIRIIAASSVVLEAFYDYNHPFYEFFKVIRLNGLDTEETHELLLKLAEIYNQDHVEEVIQQQIGRVESLRRLSGGVIRTIILLFEILIDESGGTAFQDLEVILDHVTPLYKHRMDDLSPQQQEIVEIIALNWDGISVREICERTRMESKAVSSQLNQLVKYDVVTKIPTKTKNHLYQISERFFNIWYLMRHGRKSDKRRVLWLVRFLEEWCDEEELLRRANKFLESLKVGNYEQRAAYLVSEALAHTRQISDEKSAGIAGSYSLFCPGKSDSTAEKATRCRPETSKRSQRTFTQKSR